MLKLSIDGIEVTLNKFLDPKLPRAAADPIPAMVYSLNGTSVGDGALFDTRYIWSVNALLDTTCDANIERKLGMIYQEFNRQRRALESAYILLEDTTQEIQELTPVTRTVVTGTTPVEIDDYTSYYAVFNVWMTQKPEFQQLGRFRGVTFTLMEAY